MTPSLSLSPPASLHQIAEVTRIPLRLRVQNAEVYAGFVAEAFGVFSVELAYAEAVLRAEHARLLESYSDVPVGVTP